MTSILDHQPPKIWPNFLSKQGSKQGSRSDLGKKATFRSFHLSWLHLSENPQVSPPPQRSIIASELGRASPDR